MPKSTQVKTASGASGRFLAYDAFIDEQLQKTSGQVRGADIAGAALTLVIGVLGFFMLAALADHWLVPGGLGSWGRFALWAALVGGAAYYSATRILPLLLRRINPVYAAQTIERGAPSLKNALVNFLLLKDQRAVITEPVYEAIEAQAAAGLAKAPLETAIDRTHLIHLFCVLAALMAVGGLYKVLSPKDPLRTIGRVVFPWANIQPPTRVTIVNVEPGSTTVFRNSQVPVSADLLGMPPGAEARLVWTSADLQAVDQKITLTRDVEGLRYRCLLPEAPSGVQQDLRYHVEAGDARSADFTVSVLAAPTIVVRSIDYVYPEYTGLAPQHVDHQEDIKALEGARVTLHAYANQPIASGSLDFDCNGREDKLLKAAGQEATVDFTLELTDDRRGPWHNSYQLLFRNDAGQRNTQPVAHRIEVTPDLSPEVEFLSPKSPELDVPLGASVGIEIAANDPDFELRRVKLLAAVGGRQIYEKTLLDEPRRGQFTRKTRFATAKTALKTGDVVEYWAVAEDTKAPQANRAETPRRRLRIGLPPGKQPAGDQLASRDDDVRFDDPKNAKSNPPPNDDPPQDGPGKRGPHNKSDRGKNAPAADDRPEDGDNRSGAAGRDRDKNPSRGGGDESNDESKPEDRSRTNDQKQDAGQKNSEPQGDKQQDAGSKMQDGQRAKQEGGDGQGSSQNGQPSGAAQGDGQQRAGGEQGGDEPAGNGAADGAQANGGKSGSRGDNKSGDRGAAGRNGEAQRDQAESGARQDGGPQPATGDQEGKGQQERDGSKAGSNRNARNGKDAEGSRANGGDDREDSQSVANDGSDDGSAIERILKHQEEQAKPSKQGSESRGGASASHDEPGANREAGDTPESSGQARKGDQGERRAGQGNPSQREPRREKAAGDDQQPTGQRAGEKQPGEAKAGTKPSDDPAAENKQAGAERSPQDERGQGAEEKQGAEQNHGADGQRSGKGNRSKGDRGPNPQERPQDKRQTPDAQGGDGEDDKGQSGAGASGSDNKGSPTPHGDNQQRSKKQSGGGHDPNNEGDNNPGTPSESKRQSDSQGDSQGGDRSGGGGKGGGQKANKSGTGGAGQNTAADEGAGKANSPGAGETSDEPGGDKQSDHATGNAGSKRGKGSTSSKRFGGSEGSDRPSQNAADDGEAAQSPSDDGSNPKPRGSSGKQGPDKHGPGKGPADKGSSNKDPAEQPGEGAQPGKQDGAKQPAEKKSPDRTSAEKSSPQQRGQGSDQKSGDKPNADTAGGEKPNGDKQGSAPQQGNGGDRSEQSGGGQPGADTESDQRPGGGQAGGGAPAADGKTGNQPPPPPQEQSTPAEEPNLNYARKATDMALERLKDQANRGEVDPDLLKKLGWSERDLQKFIDRWERMRQDAKQSGPQGAAARRELDESLRSLGLRPRSGSVRSSRNQDDQLHGLKESRRTRPPAEYAEQLKAYTEGAARGGEGK